MILIHLPNLEMRKLLHHQDEGVSDSFMVLILIIARTTGGSQVSAQPPWHSWKSMGLAMQMSNPTAFPIFPTLPGVRGTIWLVWRPSENLGPLLLVGTNSEAYISLPHSSEGSS